MPCYRLMQSRRLPSGKVTFLKSLIPHDLFVKLLKTDDSYMFLPCGQCVGCRLERSRQWAIRIVHEAKCYENNCFLTLTYNDEHLPHDLSLDYRDFVLFMMRFRKKFGSGIRFYMCGEYGERFRRPHYHACIFNFDFPDKVLFRQKQGNNLYTSDILEGLWQKGYCTVGSLTFDSAAYVARYIMKKQTGKQGKYHYSKLDYSTGELTHLKPEFNSMSRMPGIGKPWFEKFKTDVYPSDTVVLRGFEMKPPRYYDKLFGEESPDCFERLKEKRKLAMNSTLFDCSPERLVVKEVVKCAQIKNLSRTLDSEL